MTHGSKVKSFAFQVGTPTVGVNSYALLIRDMLLSRWMILPAFASVARFGRSKAKIVQGNQIPYLGVYINNEVMTPDGDANVGEQRFLHTLTIGISYLTQNNNSDLAENRMDSAHWALMNYFTQQRWDRSKDDSVRIEACTRVTRTHSYGTMKLDQETPTAELQMEMQFTYRTRFEPVVTDDLLVWHVDVYPNNDKDTGIDFEAEWHLPPPD
jgi:hypothetical protein